LAQMTSRSRRCAETTTTTETTIEPKPKQMESVNWNANKKLFRGDESKKVPDPV
jgi:hypothetical protein